MDIHCIFMDIHCLKLKTSLFILTFCSPSYLLLSCPLSFNFWSSGSSMKVLDIFVYVFLSLIDFHYISQLVFTVTQRGLVQANHCFTKTGVQGLLSSCGPWQRQDDQTISSRDQENEKTMHTLKTLRNKYKQTNSHLSTEDAALKY